MNRFVAGAIGLGNTLAVCAQEREPILAFIEIHAVDNSGAERALALNATHVLGRENTRAVLDVRAHGRGANGEHARVPLKHEH